MFSQMVTVSATSTGLDCYMHACEDMDAEISSEAVLAVETLLKFSYHTSCVLSAFKSCIF